MPPRMIIRRGLALLIDWLIVAVVTTMLLYPLVRDHTEQIRYGNAGIFSKSCQTIKTAPIELVDFIKDQRPTRAAACRTKLWFLFDNGITATLFYDKTHMKYDNVTITTGKRISVPINAIGIPINPVHPQGFLVLAFLIIGSAFYLTKWQGYTPGKALLGIRVVHKTRHQALKREFWRFAPFMPVLLFDLLPYSVIQALFSNTLLIISIALVFFALSLWFYILPLFRWNGKMRHDQIAGTEVVRS